MIHRSEYDKWDEIKLFRSLSIPSEVHGYSIGVEFMRDWFMEKFPKDFFKTVYINGKNIIDHLLCITKDTILSISKHTQENLQALN